MKMVRMHFRFSFRPGVNDRLHFHRDLERGKLHNSGICLAQDEERRLFRDADDWLQQLILGRTCHSSVFDTGEYWKKGSSENSVLLPQGAVG